jgi:hypothetical protein
LKIAHLAAFCSAFVAAGVGTAPALAGEIRRAAAGAIAVPFVATNAGAERIACSVTIAHWFSIELGGADPGERVTAALWSDPASGEIFSLNASGDRLPIENLWCGLAGRSWETRSAVPLERRAGVAPNPIVLTCATLAAQLRCR